jgi:hypothetical protein
VPKAHSDRGSPWVDPQGSPGQSRMPLTQRAISAGHVVTMTPGTSSTKPVESRNSILRSPQMLVDVVRDLPIKLGRPR